MEDPGRARVAFRSVVGVTTPFVRVTLGLLILLLQGGSWGCGYRLEVIDPSVIQQARAGFQEHYDSHPLVKEEILDPEASGTSERGSVFLGELLAIFPGMFVHGLGHYYAGDYRTARKLRHIGEFGYILTAAGAGLATGGYFLDKEDEDSVKGYAYSLYGGGGLIGGIGLTYFFTAWIYDMIDTPRAVKSGGQPPPRSSFVEAMDIFE